MPIYKINRQSTIDNQRRSSTMTLNLSWLRGCATALVTPFTAGGAVDEKRLRDLIEYQIAGNVRVLVPCGTTGESVTMNDEENRLVIRTTVEVSRGRAKVIAGTGSNSTAVTIERSKAARELGVDGVLTVAPYYNKPTQEGLYAHFRAVAEAVGDLPVVIYNVPGRTSSNISAETTLRLARDVENIVAVKEASGNLSQIMEILRERPKGFRVISGDDALTLPMIALGAEGLISVASNEAPELMSRMNDLALAGNWDEARALHYRLLPLMEGNFIESSPGPVKAAMALMGLVEENLRLPLVPVQEKTRARMREILSELGLLKESHVVA
jgi:4-hydroxy-tetrahydrodipicolinate synthase